MYLHGTLGVKVRYVQCKYITPCYMLYDACYKMHVGTPKRYKTKTTPKQQPLQHQQRQQTKCKIKCYLIFDPFSIPMITVYRMYIPLHVDTLK